MGKKHLSRDEYGKLKELQSMGIKGAKAARLLDRSPSSASRVYRSKSYEDYITPSRVKVPELQLPLAKGRAEKPPVPAEDNLHLNQQLATAIRLLESINSKLGVLASQTHQHDKQGFLRRR